MCIEQSSLDLLIKLKNEGKCNYLVNIVSFDKFPEEKKKTASDAGLTLYHFNDILEAGKQHPEVVLTNPKPESIYMFCYTSGTTGDPKGAMIPHSNLLSLQYAADYLKFNFVNSDVSISYLPYAHIFE